MPFLLHLTAEYDNEWHGNNYVFVLSFLASFSSLKTELERVKTEKEQVQLADSSEVHCRGGFCVLCWQYFKMP